MIIVQEPQKYSPVNNPVVVSLLSSDNNKPNFKYILDVRVNNTIVATLKASPNPTTGVGSFDISQVVKSFLTKTLNFSSNQPFQRGDIIEIGGDYGQEYLNPSGVTTFQRNLGNITKFYGFNGSLPFQLWVNFNHEDYSAFNGKLLTDSVQPVTLSSNNPYWVSVINDNVLQDMILVTRDKGGNNLGSYQVVNTFSDVTQNLLNRLLVVGVGWRQLQTWRENIEYTTLGGSPDIITDGVKSVLIGFRAFGEPIKGSVTIKLREDVVNNEFVECNKRFNESKVTLYFLNQLGGYDGFLFDMKNKKSLNIERTEGYRNVGVEDSTEVVYDISQRGAFQFNNRYTSTWEVNTDFLTDRHFKWLSQLVTSPAVWMLDNNNLIAVNVTNTDYEFKTFANNKLSQLRLDLTEAVTNTRQSW